MREVHCGKCSHYPEEEAGGDEGTAGVERSSPTGIKMCLVIRLQHTQEVSTVHL